MRRLAAAAAMMMGLLAVAGAAQAAQAGPAAKWRVVYRTDSATAGPLSSVTAPAGRDAWAVGTSGTGSVAKPLILHWNGARWRPAAIAGTAGFTPQVVTSSAADNVWVLGAKRRQSLAWIYDGTAWKRIVLPQPFAGGVFAAVSNRDAWGSVYAVCASVGGSGSCESGLLHWNGARWSSPGLPGLLLDGVVAGGHAWFLDLTSIQGLATNQITGVPVIYEATGNTVKMISTATTTRVATDAVLAVSPRGHVWVLGHLDAAKRPAVLLHWTGQGWTRATVPARADGRPLAVRDVLAYDGANGVWAGPFAHWTGQRWDNTNPGGALAGGDAYSLAAIAPIPGTASLWAVGWVTRTPAGKTRDTLIARYGPAS